MLLEDTAESVRHIRMNRSCSIQAFISRTGMKIEPEDSPEAANIE